MSVNVNYLAQNFFRYDIDGNRNLDRGEIAQASLNLIGNNQIEGSLMATFVLGGKNQNGYSFAQDGVTMNEIYQLAAASGDRNTIDSTDFQTFAPNEYQANNSADLNALRQIASENTGKFNNLGNSELTYLLGFEPTIPGPGGVRNQNTLRGNLGLISQMFNLIFSMLQLFGQFGGGGGRGGRF